MRDLHVVALSEDGRHLVLATRAGSPSGEFRVALDERLTAAVRGELPAPGRDAPPSISPRDIQARLREGETPEQIAASAGVPLSRVERYAGPVLAELERMTSGARAAVVTRPRLGPSARPLGEAVEIRLAEVAELAEGSVRWAARREQGRWVVEVSWTARGRRRRAGWSYDPGTREVVPVDGPSAVLGHVDAAPATSRSARPAPAGGARAGRGRQPSTATSTVSSTASSTATSARQPAGQARTAAPAASRPARPAPARDTPKKATRTPAAQAPATRTPAAQAPATRRSAAQAPATPQPAPRTTAKGQPRRPSVRRSAVPPVDDLSAAPTPAPAPASAPGRAPSGPPVLRVVPPTEPHPAPEEAAPAGPDADHAPARRAAGQRAGGRDWADVLMGAAPAPDPRSE